MRAWLQRAVPGLRLLVIAVVITWPAARLDALVGHERCTAGCHAWVIWAAEAQLLGGQDVGSLLFHPHGADLIRLYGSDLLGPLLLAPLVGVLGPWALVNLWVVLMVWANGLAAYALGRGLGLERGAATVLGTAFAAAPFFAHEAFNGTTELLAAWPLPLFALAWLRLLEAPSWRLGIGAGVVFGVGGLLSVYTPFFLLLIVGVSLGWWGTTRLEPLLERGRVLAMGVAGVVASSLLAPVGLLHLFHGAGALHSRRVGWSASEAPLPDAAADLQNFLFSGISEPPRVIVQGDGNLYDYWTLGTVTVGFLILGLAVLGWWRSSRRGVWPALLIASLLVSLGPWLVAGGELLRIAGSPIPGPALLLERLMPLWGVVSLHPYRFAALTALALAVLAGLGAAWLLDWLGARHRYGRLVGVPLLCVLIVAEGFLHRPGHWALPTTAPPDSASLDWLAEQERGGVLLLPFVADEIGDVCHGLFLQTVHGQPWSDGAMHFRAERSSLALYDDNAMLGTLAEPMGQPLPTPEVAVPGWADLGEAGIRYVLLDRPAYARFRGDKAWVPESHDPAYVDAWLRHHLGQPLQDDGDVVVFGIR